MNIVEFSVPILPSDQDIPKSDDLRLAPFFAELRERGVIDAEGITLKQNKLRRGMSEGRWVWRIAWEDTP